MIRRPPRSTRTDTLLPYTTLFRSELIQALVNVLWNDLTRHQKRSQPFRLTRLPSEPTAANLGHYGRVRLDELGGFIEGLFNGEEAIDLPQRAHIAIGQLCEQIGRASCRDRVCQYV